MYDYHVSNTIARSTVNQQYQSTTRLTITRDCGLLLLCVVISAT